MSKETSWWDYIIERPLRRERKKMTNFKTSMLMMIWISDKLVKNNRKKKKIVMSNCKMTWMIWTRILWNKMMNE